MFEVQLGIHLTDSRGDVVGEVAQTLPPHDTIRSDKLSERLIGPIVLLELRPEDHTDLIVVRSQVDELDQGPEGLVEISGGLHAFRIRYEAGAGIRDEALRRTDLPHLEMDAVSIGEVAHHLLTDGNSVVGEPRVHVKIYGPLIERHGLGGAPDSRRQVARPVEQCDIGRVFARQQVDSLAVEIQGLPPLLVLLEVPSPLFQAFNTAHKATLILASDLSPAQTHILTRDERGAGTRPDEEA